MNTYSATYRAPQNVIVTDKMYKRALNIYERIENTLIKRFKEAAEAFAFEYNDTINIYDFLSYNRTPKQIKHLKESVENFNSKKVTVNFNNLTDVYEEYEEMNKTYEEKNTKDSAENIKTLDIEDVF